MAEITKEELLARYAAGERDFSGLDLSGINSEVFLSKGWSSNNYGLNGCSFRGANFSYTNFSNSYIMRCDFRNTICFQANFANCVFSGIDFTGADLREANLNALEGIRVIFDNTNLKGAKGSFVHERTLCLRNCIGRNGEFIELFSEETVMRELDSRYVDEWNGIPIDQIPRIELTDTQLLSTQTLVETIDEDSIPF